MVVPPYTPAELVRRQECFDHPEFIYELKYDGFRTLAHIGPDGCRLVSRRGHVFEAFTSLCRSLQSLNRPMILDGEIVNWMKLGGPSFTRLFGGGESKSCTPLMCWQWIG